MSFDLKLSLGGLVIKDSGDLQTVQDVEKLIQDLHKIVSTPLGANKFFPWYGCNVVGLIGSLLDITFTSTIGSSQARSAIETLHKIQVEQEKSQYLSPQEQIAAIRQVLVDQNSLDPRFIRILISVANKALENLDTIATIQ